MKKQNRRTSPAKIWHQGIKAILLSLAFSFIQTGISASTDAGNFLAREIYISTKGSDSNPGTKDQPLASLKGARDYLRQLRASGKLNEGAKVIITDGTYFITEPLTLTELDSGTEGAPVIFVAEEGAKPVFVGGLQISGWEKVSDKLWKARIPEVSSYGLYFEQLYVNGKYAVRAKSPNNGFHTLKNVEEYIISKGNDKIAGMAVQKFHLFPQAAQDFKTFTKSDFNDAVLNFYHKWDNTRKRIAHFDEDSSLVFTAGNGMKSWNKLDTKSRYIVENFKAALDTCREWYLDRTGDLYYIPDVGETIANFKVFAPVTDRLIVLEGNASTGNKVQYIRFENLAFKASGYSMPLWGNEPAQAASPVDAAIIADYANQIAFVNCEISEVGTFAIWFRNSCSNSTVSQCYLHDLGAGGVKIGELRKKDAAEVTNHIIIDNNIIQHGGYVFPCAVGVIILNASDNSITHNDIADFRYSGVSAGWVWGYSYSPSKRNKIEFNHIHHLGWGELCDMGGVYTLGASEGTTVSNNHIHHVYSFDYGGWGLYTDEGSTGIVMENNLVHNCKNAGFHQHYGKENIIRNNIFAFNLNSQLQFTRVETHKSLTLSNNIVYFDKGVLYHSMGKDRWLNAITEIDYNCYWDTRTAHPPFHEALGLKEWQALGKDKHSLVSDPMFKDPKNMDFQFKSLKVAKKIGFKPFDYSKAGVYGNEEWKNLARLDSELMRRYDIEVTKNIRKVN